MEVELLGLRSEEEDSSDAPRSRQPTMQEFISHLQDTDPGLFSATHYSEPPPALNSQDFRDGWTNGLDQEPSLSLPYSIQLDNFSKPFMPDLYHQWSHDSSMGDEPVVAQPLDLKGNGRPTDLTEIGISNPSTSTSSSVPTTGNPLHDSDINSTLINGYAIADRPKVDVDEFMVAWEERPALQELMELILESPWHAGDEKEPNLSQESAWLLIDQALRAAPEDTLFRSTVVQIRKLPKSKRLRISLYAFFKDQDGKCILCAPNGKTAQIGHIRFHFQHKPIVCDIGASCTVCKPNL
jgi:hypothetical protein